MTPAPIRRVPRRVARALVATVAAAAIDQAPLPAQTVTAITSVRLIDGTGAAPLERATVIVRGDRIAAVGAAAQVPIPAGATRIDGRGLTLLPGLADLHTHLTGGWDGISADFLGARRTLGALLYAGVTTVLDPGDVTSWVRQLATETEAGRIAGPRIYYTGTLLDGPKPIWPDLSMAVSSPDQIPHFVAILKRAGASLVKAYMGLSDDMVRQVVEAARHDSLRVIADLGPRNGSIGSAQTGIAGFAHAGARPTTDEALRYMAAHDVRSISTLAVYESFAGRRFADPGFLDHPLLRDVLPPNYAAAIRRYAARVTAPSTDPPSSLGAAFPVAMANVKRMVDAGILVAAGTDAPYPGDYYGEGLHRELELLVEAGLTPVGAIAVATGNAARWLGAEREWGTVAPGLAADLLLVRGDPSRQIDATRNVVTVIQRGRIVDRARLRYDPTREPDVHPAGLEP